MAAPCLLLGILVAIARPSTAQSGSQGAIPATPTCIENHNFQNILPGSVDYKDAHIFVEPSYEAVLRSRDEAVEFCHEEGAELLKIEDTVFLRKIVNSGDLSLSYGTYWIDGKLNGTGKEAARDFVLNTTCSDVNWSTHTNKLPVDKKEVNLCLALTKAYYTKDSTIKVKNCEDKYYALCVTPAKGCKWEKRK